MIKKNKQSLTRPKGRTKALTVNHYPLAILPLIILLHSWILTKLIFFPQPEFFIYPYLTNRGLFPYRQILDQHFPGLMFFPVNLDNLGMNTASDARLWAIGIVILVHLLLFFIGKRLFGSSKKALLANLLFLIWQPFFEGWVLWIDSFLPLFLLSAFYFTYRAAKDGRTKDLFLAGIFFGAALVFKQVVLPLIVLVAAALFWQRRNARELVWLGLGLSPLPLLMVLYFWLNGAFSDFWYWAVTYNLTVFAEYGRKLPFASGLFRGIAVFGFAVFSWLHKDKRLSFWLSLFILGSLAAVFARFDFVHLQPALPFVILASVLSFEWIWENKLARPLAAIYLFGMVAFLSVFYRGHVGDKVLFFDEETLKLAERIKQETNPGDHIFVYGAIPHLYQMTETLPAGDVFVFQFPWFLRVVEDRVLDGVKRDKPELVVADRSVTIAGEKITDYAARINSYLLENYETKDRIGNTEFLLRRNND